MVKGDNTNKPNIAILANAVADEGKNAYLANFIEIFKLQSNEIFVIDGDFPKDPDKRVHIIKIKADSKKESMLIRAIKLILVQLRFSLNLIKIYRNIDIVILFGATMILPMLSAKFMKKKTVVTAGGFVSESAKKIYKNRSFGMGGVIFPSILRMLEYVNFHLADQIVIESEGSINFLRLNKYRKKIAVTGTMFVDTDNFKITKDLNDRRNIIGYIGRLSHVKGVMNFANAIPLILKEMDYLEFLIGGDGVLFNEIKNELKNNGSYDKVELPGWISHDELPKYLNELKLIVAPSYMEGGVPAVIEEAMACGTIVLVTPVAGVGVIKDGESGFILEDNSPECIAENVIRALEQPNLDEIISNAYNLVEEEFSYETEVKQYRKMLYTLLHNK